MSTIDLLAAAVTIVGSCKRAFLKKFFFNITALFAVGYISEVKLQVAIQLNLPHYN